ncbi:unnamed protein product [marine sediment metagenome]|uniref:Uncharacterized protein n=1 Tax=marine sediment metagenome TaxID=412755 RepID=X1JHH8_9ZZZZ
MFPEMVGFNRREVGSNIMTKDKYNEYRIDFAGIPDFESFRKIMGLFEAGLTGTLKESDLNGLSNEVRSKFKCVLEDVGPPGTLRMKKD